MPLDDDARRKAAETKRIRTANRISQAVDECFRSDGRITHARVAEVSGLSEATVYRYFPTKQALYDLATTAELLTPEESIETGVRTLMKIAHGVNPEFATAITAMMHVQLGRFSPETVEEYTAVRTALANRVLDVLLYSVPEDE